MRFTQYLGLLFVMALAMSVNAFAKGTHKEANSGNFTVQEHLQIGSTDIAPGQYKAEWSGPANNLKVESCSMARLWRRPKEASRICRSRRLIRPWLQRQNPTIQSKCRRLISTTAARR